MLSYKYNGVIAVVMSYFHSFTFWFHEIFYKFSIFNEIKIFMLVQKGFASAILQWNKFIQNPKRPVDFHLDAIHVCGLTRNVLAICNLNQGD